MEWVGLGFDATGVLVIAGGAVVAAGRMAASASTGKAMDVRRFRQGFGAAIVLGLEFLVAGDIIRTVAVAPTLENVTVLAIIVVIRTVLSMALQVEIEGRWPWQQRGTGSAFEPSPSPRAATEPAVAGCPAPKGVEHEPAQSNTT